MFRTRKHGLYRFLLGWGSGSDSRSKSARNMERLPKNMLLCYVMLRYSSVSISELAPFLDMSNTAGYLGCFRDSSTSHDLEYLADIRPLSIRACVTKCKSMRFPYAGVQSSTSCYCGLHYGKHGQLEHEDCNTPCEADSSEMCGGVSMNSLYHTGSFESN